MAAETPLTCAGVSRWYGIRAFSYLRLAATFSAIPGWFFSLRASCTCQGKRHLNSISRVSAPHLKISLPGWPSLRWQYLRGDRQHSSSSTNSLCFVPILSLRCSRCFSFLPLLVCLLFICLSSFLEVSSISSPPKCYLAVVFSSWFGFTNKTVFLLCSLVPFMSQNDCVCLHILFLHLFSSFFFFAHTMFSFFLFLFTLCLLIPSSPTQEIPLWRQTVFSSLTCRLNAR